MPQINLQSKFTSYTFDSDAELTQAQSFTLLNEMFIQSEIASLAERRIAMLYDPENPMGFIQQDAEIKGQIGILEYLLDLSRNARDSSSSTKR